MNKKNRTLESWNQLQQELKIGDVVTGTVFQVERYGSYVDIGKDFYGIVLAPYISEEPIQRDEDYPQIGEIISARIMGFSGNKESSKMEFNYMMLSIKDL